jgi:hypothetical protein
MRHLLNLAAALLTLLFLAGTHASAGPMGPSAAQWTYNFEPKASAVASDSGAGRVSFTDEPTKAATGTSDVVATNLRVFSSADPSAPDTLNSSGAYQFKLVLTDKASGDTATLTFTGKLSGTFSATNANVTNAFTGNSTQDVVLGNFDYKVSFPTAVYAPPGPPGASNAGSISALVTVSLANVHGGGGGGGPQTVPEPSAFDLAGFAVAALGLAGWRRRGRVAPLAA